MDLNGKMIENRKSGIENSLSLVNLEPQTVNLNKRSIF